MRLHALLRMPELGLTLLSGRRHLDREIRRVVPTDLHDPRRYLTGGELVLTGLMWRRDGDSETYVRNLTAAGVTALGVGDHPDTRSIPDDLVAACESQGLPLLTAAPDLALADLTERIAQRLSAGPSGGLASLLDRHRRFAAVDGTGQILELLRAELGTDCLVLSPTGRPLRGTLALTASERAAIVGRVHGATALPQHVTLARDRCVTAFGIESVFHTGQFLVVGDDSRHWPRERRLVTEQLAALLMLELDDPSMRPERHTELVTAIDSGDVDEDVLYRAGLPADVPMALLVAAGTPEPLREVLVAETLAGARDAWPASATAWATREGETVALITGDAAAPAARPKLLAWARRCAEILATGDADASVRIGVADPVRTAGSLQGALEQARHTAALVRRGRGIEVAEPDHLVSHRMLLAAVPAEVRSAFRTRVLDPIIEDDARHRSDLLVTLRRFLDSDGSWRQCAEALQLHVNTVRHRMRRVEQLTGRDLRNPLDRMDLALAMSLDAEPL